MPDPTGMGGSNKNMSVFGLLNRCKTSQGTRMLAQWLKQPLVNLHKIGPFAPPSSPEPRSPDVRQNNARISSNACTKIRSCVSPSSCVPFLALVRALLTPPQDDFLKSMPDLHRISKRFQKGAANLEDVVRVYQALLLLPGLVTLLEVGGQANEKWPPLIEETYLVQLRVRPPPPRSLVPS